MWHIKRLYFSKIWNFQPCSHSHRLPPGYDEGQLNLGKDAFRVLQRQRISATPLLFLSESCLSALTSCLSSLCRLQLPGSEDLHAHAGLQLQIHDPHAQPRHGCEYKLLLPCYNPVKPSRSAAAGGLTCPSAHNGCNLFLTDDVTLLSNNVNMWEWGV